MQLNYLAILLATALQFALGFVWYGPIFGKPWGKMHGFDKLSKEVQQEMMKKMGPLYGVQAVVTLITTIVLSLLLTNLPTWNAYVIAGLLWIGFVVPTQVSGILFGGTKPEWFVTKMAIMVVYSLISLEAAAALLHFLG